MPVVKAGEKVRFDCPGCNAEFEVTVEPKMVGKSDDTAVRIAYCPSCGETDITGDFD